MIGAEAALPPREDVLEELRIGLPHDRLQLGADSLRAWASRCARVSPSTYSIAKYGVR
jgi:hypothetical protein